MDISILKENGIDVNKSLELFGDIETYNDTLNMFLTEADDKINKLSHYKEIADTPNYLVLISSLKSDANCFGFTKLEALANNHELEGKKNNIYYMYDHFDELLNELYRILNVIRKYFGKEEINIVKENNKIEKTILVVDDSSVISTFVKKIFKDEYNVKIANDGREAIDALDDLNIKAMLLDLNMPNVNGFVVLEYLKQNDLFKRIPVSIITGVGDDEIVNQTFMYPIVDVLRKPFNERDIKIVLEKTLNNL